MDYLGYAISAAGGGGGGGGGGGSSFDPLLIDSDLVPTDTATYDVGRSMKRWRNGEFTTVNATTGNLTNVNCATIGGVSALAAVNVTALNGVTSSKYIVNGGTDQQYLMGDGSLLKYSANSGNSNFYLYNSSQVITAPPPSGSIRYNNIVQDNATQIYISHLTRDNIDIDVFFTQITTITEVYIQDQNSSTNFIQYNVLETPSVTPNNYVTISVSKRSSNGTGSDQFPDGHNILLSFFTNGIEVDERLTTLETKTRNQTASTTTTTFTGTGGIVATKHIVPSGLTSQFLKANGDLDSSSYLTIPSANTTYLALTGGTLTGALSGTSFTGSSLFSPSLDTVSAVGLAVGATTQTGLTLGRVGATTILRGSTITTTGNIIPATTNTNTIGTSALTYSNGFFTALTTPSIDTATATAQNIGTVTQNILTLGRVGATTNLRGLSIVTTGNITPGTTNVGTIGTSALTYNNVFTNQITTAGTTPLITLGTGTTVTGAIVPTVNAQLLGSATNRWFLFLNGMTTYATGSNVAFSPSSNEAGTLGASAGRYNNVYSMGLDVGGTTPLVTLGTGTTVTGNVVPTATTTQNLGSATNRWNVFAQTLTLPNTAGICTTNYVATSSTTVGNTASISSLFGTGNGSLAVVDAVGTNRRVKCSGILSAIAFSTLTFQLSSSTQVAFINSYSMGSTASTSVPFVIDITYSIRGTNTYIGFATFQFGTNTPVLFQYTTTNTLGSGTYDLKCYWNAANADSTITSNNGTFETLA